MRFIGCKTQLLDIIEGIIDENAPEAKTLCDIFSGTSVVARHFKKKYEVTSNDILFFSYVLQRGTVENDIIPSFQSLQKELGIHDVIRHFNQKPIEEMELLPQERRFFQNNYAPTGGRMYINDTNALRIDFARNTVEDWYKDNLLSDDEYFYLLACIIEGIPFVSNTSGTYGAYHKSWERRSFKTFELVSLPVFTNRKHNKAYNEDGVELLKHLYGDVLYIDPPYNGRQYLTNYHVLETAAAYDNPVLRGVTGQRPYENKKSEFCLKTRALKVFEQLIKNANYKHILLSYNTDGIMDINDVEEIMQNYSRPGTYKLYEIPYRRYKSRQSNLDSVRLSELIFYMEKRL